jgi:uncharacterized protein with HEPN domain
MSRSDPYTRLLHMRDHARGATFLVAGRTRADLDSDRVLNLALVRLVEVVGEAAARVPPEVRAQHSGIPWPRIVGVRNRLIHGYDTISVDILWEIITTNLPPLGSDGERNLAGIDYPPPFASNL